MQSLKVTETLDCICINVCSLSFSNCGAIVVPHLPWGQSVQYIPLCICIIHFKIPSKAFILNPWACVTHLRPMWLNFCQAVTHSEYMRLGSLHIHIGGSLYKIVDVVGMHKYAPTTEFEGMLLQKMFKKNAQKVNLGHSGSLFACFKVPHP